MKNPILIVSTIKTNPAPTGATSKTVHMKTKSMHHKKEYILTARKNGAPGWILLRVKTGKLVKITQSMINKTRQRLEDGEQIPFRKISYTVAIETGVVEVLKKKGIINVDSVNKTYSLK